VRLEVNCAQFALKGGNCVDSNAKVRCIDAASGKSLVEVPLRFDDLHAERPRFLQERVVMP
jgi:hypothetical protein